MGVERSPYQLAHSGCFQYNEPDDLGSSPTSGSPTKQKMISHFYKAKKLFKSPGKYGSLGLSFLEKRWGTSLKVEINYVFLAYICFALSNPDQDIIVHVDHLYMVVGHTFSNSSFLCVKVTNIYLQLLISIKLIQCQFYIL